MHKSFGTKGIKSVVFSLLWLLKYVANIKQAFTRLNIFTKDVDENISSIRALFIHQDGKCAMFASLDVYFGSVNGWLNINESNRSEMCIE